MFNNNTLSGDVTQTILFSKNNNNTQKATLLRLILEDSEEPPRSIEFTQFYVGRTIDRRA